MILNLSLLLILISAMTRRGKSKEEVRATDLLDDLDQVLEHLLPAPLVGDDSCGQVAKDVGAHGLNGIQVPGSKQVGS